jgi:DNA-binding NarL/FixJ family response regulator
LSSKASAVSNGRKIWLVEDNASYRNALARVVNHQPGMTCEQTFSSCEDALAGLGPEKAPDVILLDVRLPGMSGIDGIKRFRDAAPNVRILILTMFDDHEKVFKAICAGASGYLLKSSPQEKIAEAIGEALQGGCPMNAQVARLVLERFTALAPPSEDYGLTDREREVLELMVNGLIKKEIADKLSLSYHTIDSHLRNIYQKLHVNTRAGAVVKAVREHLF